MESSSPAVRIIRPELTPNLKDARVAPAHRFLLIAGTRLRAIGACPLVVAPVE